MFARLAAERLGLPPDRVIDSRQTVPKVAAPDRVPAHGIAVASHDAHRPPCVRARDISCDEAEGAVGRTTALR